MEVKNKFFGGSGSKQLYCHCECPTLQTGFWIPKISKDRLSMNCIGELTRAVRRARELLSEIADEITNRDNKTCLLLPCKNFGEDIYKILDCVHGVSREREATFQNRLNSILPSLRTSRVQKRTYYVGKNGLVFRSPGKAGARHGLAPSWSVPDHKLSCVIRGRMRFGVSYDPKFHYDCDISKISKRRFPSCHDFKKIRKSKRHINIAPNDNVR